MAPTDSPAILHSAGIVLHTFGYVVDPEWRLRNEVSVEEMDRLAPGAVGHRSVATRIMIGTKSALGG